MFILYYLLHGIALGGINSALTNLIFEYIPSESSADALAVTQAFSGLAGFLTTLCISPLVSYIQNNGNSLFGLPIYAQQFVTLIALTFTVLAIFYTDMFLSKIQIKKLDRASVKLFCYYTKLLIKQSVCNLISKTKCNVRMSF